jgi:O-antigen ligase
LLVAILFGSLGFAIAGWTGTRAAIVAILIASVIGIFVLPIGRKLAIMLFTSAFNGLMAAAVLPLVHPSYGIFRMFGASREQGIDSDISSGRVEIWINMLDKVIQRPIMGWGIDQFRFSFNDMNESIRHPHNGIMQLIFSTGLWGLVATMMIALSFVKHFPAKFTQPYQSAAFVLIIGTTAYGLVDGIFYFGYPIMIFIVAGACLVAAKPSVSSDRSN